MSEDDRISLNRRAWNEVAPIHAARRMDALRAGFARPGYGTLDATLTALLTEIGVRGLDVAQLCCNNGRELLSVLNLGARRGVGFDLSDAFLAQARELAEIAGLPATFHHGPVEEIPASYDGSFDRALATVGTLWWLADLDAFFATAARLLRPGGALVLYEMHPILEIYEGGGGDAPLQPKHDYFDRGPFRDTDGLDYYGHEDYEASPAIGHHHTMGDVMTACVKSGLAIESLREFGHDISNSYSRLEREPARPPMCYTLVARKGPRE